MPLVITQDWSDRELGGDRSSITFKVTGAASLAQARDSVPYQPGATDPLDSRLVMLTKPVAIGEPPAMTEVRCEFVLPSNDTGGGGGNEPPEDLLAKPPTIRIEQVLESFPTDYDRNGNLITNAAGDVYNPKLNRIVPSVTIAITKYRDTFPVQLLEYVDYINTDTISITGTVYSFGVGWLKLLSISAPEFAADSLAIPITLSMQIKSGGSFPHRSPALNQGRNGWWSDGGTKKYGRFTTSSGDPVSDDILLNTDGTPVDTSLTVDGNPPTSSQNIPVGWVSDSRYIGRGVMQLWETYRGQTSFMSIFNQLGI